MTVLLPGVVADLAQQHTTNGAAMTDIEVPIHNESGCGIDGSTEAHTHPYSEWKEALDAAVAAGEPSAAEWRFAEALDWQHATAAEEGRAR